MGVTVITGAAGGMGAPSARSFAEAGRSLVLCDLSAERLDAVAAPLRRAGADIELLAADISDPGFPARLMATLDGRTMDALVHTAGLSPSMADGERIMAVNFFATERLVDAVRASMAAGGCIVLFSSISAYMAKSPEIDAAITALVTQHDPKPALALATTPQTAYPLSKRAIIALVAREAVALGHAKARIVSIAPGFIDTGMGRLELESSGRKGNMVAKVPLGRMGLGEEIASVVRFLCSPAASYISGCDIKVDGGALPALGFA
jgi:NAD(P)-dependent dehydrogenase (short-subunit alcohol dehydrogenase family)